MALLNHCQIGLSSWVCILVGWVFVLLLLVFCCFFFWGGGGGGGGVVFVLVVLFGFFFSIWSGSWTLFVCQLLSLQDTSTGINSVSTWVIYMWIKKKKNNKTQKTIKSKPRKPPQLYHPDCRVVHWKSINSNWLTYPCRQGPCGLLTNYTFRQEHYFVYKPRLLQETSAWQ